LEQAIAMRSHYEFQVSWRPFQLNPDIPPSGLPRREYLIAKFGGAERADRVYESIRKAGEEIGLNFDFQSIPHQPNSFDSHRLVRWSETAGTQDSVVEKLFFNYFVNSADVGDQELLISIASECGMDGELVRYLFREDADRDLVMSEEGLARRGGINGVPCFVIDNKYAVTGAQDPSVLTNVFDLAMQDQNKLVASNDHETAGIV